jgi:hypothetical protein
MKADPEGFKIEAHINVDQALGEDGQTVLDEGKLVVGHR